MTVEPGVTDLFLVDLSGGQICLGVLTVYHISVVVYIVKCIILTDTLGLIIKLLSRDEVIDPDIAYGLCIFHQVSRIQSIVGCKVGGYYIVKLICVLGVFYIPLEIFRLLVQFVR